MKTSKFTCIFFLTLIFVSCTKKEQEMVLESGYTIKEGGEAVKDYRKNFEGLYFLDCIIDGSSFKTDITILAVPTRSESVFLESLFKSGDSDTYTGPEIVAKITPDGQISFSEQVLEYRVYPGASPTLHTFSHGSGIISSDNKIQLTYNLRFGLDNPLICNCHGERK